MKKLLGLLLALLLMPSLSGATGLLTRAANPQEDVWILSQSGIPFIKSSSGTMGNNCAISGMTALPRTFSSGAYLYLPAGAIAAGVPASADWYWFVASSTTAGTCYNQTYSSNKDAIGTPKIPPSNTAFSTTGPGAYAGSTGSVTAVSLTLPAGSMGINGQVALTSLFSNNNSAGTKADNTAFGGVSASSLTNTTNTSTVHTAFVQNRGVTNNQSISRLAGHSGSTGIGSMSSDGAIDTTSAVTITFALNCNTATDHHILEMYSVMVKPRS